MSLKFTDDEVKERFEQFVSEFLSGEEDVKREEILPQFWVVSVQSKDFKVSITCECIGHFHGIEQWSAVVQEPDGEKTNFLLFEDEIEKWALEQREKKTKTAK